MNERDQPAAEFERAPTASDHNSASGESFPAPTEQAPVEQVDFAAQSDLGVQELASAYSRRSRRAVDSGSTDGAAPLFPAGAPPHPDARHSEFRVRDFGPDARSQSAAPRDFAAPAPRAEPMRDIPRWTPSAADDDGRLNYYTQGVPLPPVQPAPRQASPPVSAPATPAAVVDSVPAQFAAPPRPLTRRQLRELEISQGIRPQADDAPPAPPVVASPAPLPPVPVQQTAMPPVIRLVPPVPAPVPTTQRSPQQISPEPVIFTHASGSAPANRAPVAPQPVAATSLASSRGIDSAPLVFTPPDAHSAQPHLDTVHQPGDSFIRTVGGSSGSLTTSALVIPSIPQVGDITRPFSSTGEILVTGSIDLPMSLASTGANSARFDHSDIDALFAQEDHDYAPTDSAPVRAIRAVSTHTSTHGVISARKPASNRLPMLMAVTAGILAVGVAALFAAGMIFGYF